MYVRTAHIHVMVAFIDMCYTMVLFWEGLYISVTV